MVVVVLGEGEAVGHVLGEDFGSFVTVVVMVVLVVVMFALMVVMALLAVLVIVVRVSTAHLQHDKVEGFDARGFEFKHVITFFHAVNVNHGVRGTCLGAVDGFLSRRVLVALVVVFFVLLVVIMLFFLSGEVRCFVGSFVEVLAQVSDEDRLKLKRDVTVGHGVGGHGLRG